MTRHLLSQASGLDITDDSLQRVEAFCDLVRKWTPRINLVAKASLDDIWVRHVLDSAQLYPLAPKASAVWADLGSGGGFPGIVLAILSQQDAPERRHVLIESDQRKAVFLREAGRVLGCNVSVISDRIERATPVGADVVTARALAALPQLLGLVARHMKPAGVAVLPKGAGYLEELALARAEWQFSADSHPSLSGPDGHILRISGLMAQAEGR